MIKNREMRNIVPIKQVEFSECGLACLSMILNYYSVEASLNSLRGKYPDMTQGMRPYDIKNVAEDYGFSAKIYKINLNELDILSSPSIILNNKHYSLIVSINDQHVEVVDPVNGRICYTKERFFAEFSGINININITKVKKIEQKNNSTKKINFWDIYKNKKQVISALLKIIGLASVVQFFAMLAPQFPRYLIDTVIPSNSDKNLYIAGIAFLTLAVVGHLFSFIRSNVVLRISQKLTMDAVSGVFKHLLFLPLRFFENRHVGDISSRMNSMGRLQQTIITDVPSITLNIVVIISTFFIMLSMEWRLCLISVAFVSVQLYYSHLLNQKRSTLEGLKVKSSALLSSSTLEAIQSYRMIKLFGIENRLYERWKNHQEDVYNDNFNASKQSIYQHFFEATIASLHLITITAVGVFIVMLNTELLTVGSLIAILAYQRILSSATGSTIRQLNSLNRLNVHLDRLSDIVLEPKENLTDLKDKISDNIDVSFNQVGFYYDNSNVTLISNISLTLKPNQTIAIVGSSGAGKTTLAKLLLGLYSSYSGSIKINNIELKSGGANLLRKNCGVVLQNDFLLSGTVAENISMFDELFDMKKVILAAETASIHNEIAIRPMGYDTQVGGLTSSFSSGQIQRILIARALYRQPKILIMDEGTANLDEINELKIGKSLQLINCAKVYITHRPALIEFADVIYHMGESGLEEITEQEAVSFMQVK